MKNEPKGLASKGAPRLPCVLRPTAEWRVLAVVGTIVLLYLYLRPLVTVVILFALGLLLAAALHPTLTWIEERVAISRGVLAGILVAGFLAIVAAFLWWVVPLLLGQLLGLAQQAPAAFEDLRRAMAAFARHNPALAEYALRQLEGPQIQGFIADLLGHISSLGLALGTSLLAGLLVMVVAIYSLVHPVPLVTGLLTLRPPEERERITQSVRESLHKVRAWLGGTLIAMVSVGTASGVALWLLGVPYALLFGVVAGLLEVVPTIGPILGAVPPMVVALLQEPIRALWVAIAFTVVQQLENHILIPMVMGNALRVHPVLILFGILVMGTLFGLLGVFLAVPLLAVAQAVAQEFHRPPDGEEEAAREQARSALEMRNVPERMRDIRGAGMRDGGRGRVRIWRYWDDSGSR